MRQVRNGKTQCLSDPKGYWSLCFKDVLGCSYLDRPIEVIKGRQMMGELALLKTRSMNPGLDDTRERLKRLQEEGWMATASH
ncbi:DUF1651 domain-containing protein [Prochlorococcus sp. MIT 1306]|uniref:DUF1651 domain-containing protein n=1 Tax=Prochlorococcus sp. MIT 1306 TaxID=1799667 RepID=UPI00094127E2|nr:DUF1651 domain-containing protein [Prochlorococcus sp. MIT 1306]